MMADQIMNFIEGLVEKTREKKLNWMPFPSCKEKYEIYNRALQNFTKITSYIKLD